MNKIGIIGLGNMGSHMARRLAEAGYDLMVCDSRDELKNQYEAMGAKWSASAAEMADAVECIVVSLPTPAIVEAVLLGDSGVISGRKVRLVIDTSTTGPEVSRRVALGLQSRGIQLIDAPVSGGPQGAESGALTIMAAGSQQAFEEALEILQVIGRKIFYLGADAGQGQLMKIINNTICAAGTLAAFEGLVLGARANLDAKTMLDVLNASSGRNFATEVKIPQCVLERNFPQRFSTDLLHKDVRLCVDEAARLGVPVWVSECVRQMLSFAITQGGGPLDYGHLIKHYESWAGVQFGSDPLAEHVTGDTSK